MKKLFALTALLLSVSCTTATPKSEPAPKLEVQQEQQAVIDAPACFVKWNVPSHKSVFEQAHGMTGEQKAKKGMIFNFLEDDLISVTSKLNDGTYAAMVGASKVGQKFLIKKFDNVFTDANQTLLKELLLASYKLSGNQIKELTEGMERVDCEEFFDSAKLQDYTKKK